MVRLAVAFVFVGLVTGHDARAAGTVPLPPSAAIPPRAGGLPEPLVLPASSGCTLRAVKSSAGATLEIAPGVPYARVAQARSIEVALPIGRDTPAAGVLVEAGN